MSQQGAARKALVSVLLVIIVLAAVLGWGYWYYLKRNVKMTAYADPLERYKYQSIGSEPTALPYYIWQVLPEICPEQLPPGGYAGFGWIYEPGHDRPVGMTLRTVGVPRAGITCAACHTGTVRTTPDGARMIIPALSSHQLDLQRYARFLMQCVSGPSYTTDKVMAAIDRKTSLGPLDHLVYRYVIVPGLRHEVQRLSHRLEWMDSRPPFGPGRFDAFSPVKVDFGFDMSKDDSIATVDYPAIWNQQARKGMALHWDGSNSSVRDRNIAAGISAGAVPDTIDLDEVDWITGFLANLAPPKFPYPIDSQLADDGKLVFDAHCSRCHAPGGSQTGHATPVAEIGTDSHRYYAFNQAFANKMNSIGEGYVWKIKGYKQSTGYLNLLLDGIWARAPYLHNGSVPSLRELLDPVEKRRPVFYRGYDLYDQTMVGFVSEGAEAEKIGQRYDTHLPGNGNAGHLYGVDLSEESKRALLEYLKTF